MRLTCLLTVLLAFSATASVNAQQGKVTIDVKSATLSQVLMEVKDQTGAKILYNENLLRDVECKDLKLEGVAVEEALNQILAHTPFSYVVDGGVVVIQRRSAEPQRTVVIQGKVVDTRKQPVPGVTVIIQGTTLGTTTGEDGTFALEIPEREGITLLFSFIGMKTVSVAYTGQENLQITMEEEAAEIEEVVVTGIFTRKKESFTGSASSFTQEELKRVGSSNILQSLKTLDPAFAIMDNVQFGSDPNQLPNMEIRGKSSMLGMRDELENDPNQPLFILDGFESSIEAINDLDINRIESITILKDAASTAIYGSKAANGVVVVETVKPQSGELQVSYNGNMNLSIPDLTSYNLMNASEKLEFERLAGRYDPSIVETPYRTETEIELTEMYYDRLRTIAEGVDTYWLAEPLRVGVNQKHSLYVMGGEEHFLFGLGAGYNGVSGVMKDSKRQVISGNIDLIYRVSKFQFSNKFSFSSTDYSNPVVPFSDYASANPFHKKKNADGTINQWLEYEEGGVTIANPLWNASLNSRDTGKDLNLTNYFIAEWNPSSLWKVRARFGLTYTNSDTEVFTSPENTDQILNKETTERGEYTETNTKSNQYEGELTVTFAQLFGRHRLNLVGGGNIFSSNSLLSGNTVEGFPAGDFTYPSFASGYPENALPTYVESVSHSVNAYFNAGYSFDDRYLLDVSLRLNGSSVFGSTSKYNTTWSVGLGWNLHKEKFMMNHLGFINLFKIRASIGNPGNQSFDSGRTLITYAFQSGDYPRQKSWLGLCHVQQPFFADLGLFPQGD